MPMQHNVGVVRRFVRRDMLEPKSQSVAHEIDNQRPFKIAVAISANDSDPWSDRAKHIENAFRANIPKMPDFVGAHRHFLDYLRQAIVRVREDENPQHLFRFLWLYHVQPKSGIMRCACLGSPR